jgi:hypothetical protein
MEERKELETLISVEVKRSLVVQGEREQHMNGPWKPKVGIRNLNPRLRNVADNQIDCGVEH